MVSRAEKFKLTATSFGIVNSPTGSARFSQQSGRQLIAFRYKELEVLWAWKSTAKNLAQPSDLAGKSVSENDGRTGSVQF